MEVVWHGKFFIHISLLASVHCKEALVLFEASGFCYNVDAGLWLGLLEYPVVVLCYGDPAALDMQDWLRYIYKQTRLFIGIVVISSKEGKLIRLGLLSLEKHILGTGWNTLNLEIPESMN